MNQELSKIDFIRELISDCRYDEAQEMLSTAMEDEPDNVDYNYELARIFMEMGNWASAISHLEYTVEHVRSHLLYYMLAEAYQADNQLDRAIGAYLKSIMLNEKFAIPYKKLGILFMGRNDNLSALEYFEDYIKLDVPEDEKEQIGNIIKRIKK